MTRYTGFLSVHVAEALFLCLTSMKRLRRVPLASDQPPLIGRLLFGVTCFTLHPIVEANRSAAVAANW